MWVDDWDVWLVVQLVDVMVVLKDASPAVSKVVTMDA